MERFSLINHLEPELKVALVYLPGLQLKRSVELEDFIFSRLKEIKSGLSKEAEINRLLNRKLYSFFHLDPTKERPSAEKLWRRIRRNEEFPRIHPLLDLINLLSLCWQVLYGVYDAEKVYPPIEVRLGNENDTYLSVGNQQLNLDKKIVLVDQRGAFGNPTADSRRAAIESNTRDFLIAIYGAGSMENFSFYFQQTRQKIKDFFSFSWEQ